MELTNLWILFTSLILLNLIFGGLLSLIVLLIVSAGSYALSKLCLSSPQSFIKALIESNGGTKPYLEDCLTNQGIVKFLKTREKDEIYFCLVCQERRCFKHGPEAKVDLFPDRKILINCRLNQLLEENINLCLIDVESLKNNTKLCQEVRRCISFIAGNLMMRIRSNIDPTEFISKRLLTLLTQHLYLFLRGKRQAKSAYFIQEQVVKVYREEGYYCDSSYLHSLIKSCHHLLLSPTILSNSTYSLFSLELIVNCVLEPFLDLISNPYYFNTFFILLLEGMSNVNTIQSDNSSTSTTTTSNQEPKMSHELHQLLDNFSKPACDPGEDNAVGLTLKEVMKDEQLLFIFMQYLKEEGSVNLIQFLLSVDSFNSRLLKPDLNEEEKSNLTKELELLFQEYFDEENPDYIHFKDSTIKESLSLIVESRQVVLLQTSDPLYKAYDQVYHTIDRVYLPLFIKSSYYFKLVAGSRHNQSLSMDTNEDDNVSLSSQISSLTESSRKFTSEDSKDKDSIKEGEENKAEKDLQIIHDLSSWQITVERVEKRWKNDFDDDEMEDDDDRLVYLIKVNDIKEGSSWEIQREFDEFHVLQSKLRQFHGSIKGIDIQLPKRKIQLFSSSSSYPCTQTNISFLEGHMNELQNFLETLLSNPALQSSSLLHSFLKPSALTNQFNSSSVDFKKMLRNINSSLSLKSGSDLRASLQPFILNLISSTENKRSNGSQDKETAGGQPHKENSNDYDDALDTMTNDPNSEIKEDDDNTNASDGKGNTLYELILFIMNSIYDLDESNSQAYYILKLIEPLLRDTLQLLLTWFLEIKLKNVVTLDNCILALENLKLSLETRRGSRDVHEEEKLRKVRETEALRAIQNRLNSIPFSSSSLSFHLYYCFQFSQLNKQFLYLILNQLFLYLFPEVFS